RSFLKSGAAGLAATLLGRRPAVVRGADDRKPTRFQIACMTLPYARFSVERALAGIKGAGFKYVAWGTSHQQADAKSAPLLSPGAAPDTARERGQRCRGLGLEPLMMFSGIYPDDKDALDVFRSRIKQAAAGGVPQVLTFGDIRPGKADPKLWVERFRK